MQNDQTALIGKVRKLLSDYTTEAFTFKQLSHDLGVPVDQLTAEFGNEAELVNKILAFEQKSLEDVFINYDFDTANAIDALLSVSKAISQNFTNISPSINFDLRRSFPEARQRFVEKRIHFVNSKIKSNFEQGMRQGYYRPDLSAELVARIYISRLIDLHNPDFFPNESISFPVLFDVMFDTFIRGIVTDEGKSYYEKKIKRLKF